jgi:hypothetical protein
MFSGLHMSFVSFDVDFFQVQTLSQCIFTICCVCFIKYAFYQKMLKTQVVDHKEIFCHRLGFCVLSHFRDHH